MYSAKNLDEFLNKSERDFERDFLGNACKNLLK
jgi:hypothetical protein